MSVHEHTKGPGTIDRREAIRRVTLMLGGVTLVGGSSLLTACERLRDRGTARAVRFTDADIALLDEIAETILPATSTPGAKAAQTGAFMALMVTDAYDPRDQRVFREGLRAVDEASRGMHGVSFMEATPAQRLAVLEPLDREQHAESEARREEDRLKGLTYLSDERAQAAPVVEAATADERAPAHYFRMMKELALLGYFTSEIGCTQAQRYIESPGRFDPCAPYTPGETSWAPHA